MSYVETGSGRLYYDFYDLVPEWVEQPETIVFHYGIAANVHIWTPWLPVLATRYRLLRFDMRGFGKSVQPGPDFPWSIDGLVQDLLCVAEAAGVDRFHLVGESTGGTVSLACALRFPHRLLSLTLSNAAARGGLVATIKGWRDVFKQDGQKAWAEQMMRFRFYPDALAPAVNAWYTRLHETCSADAVLGLADMLLAADLTPRLPEIRVPTLLLSPEASPFIPLEVMASMRAAIPDAELHVIGHSRHGLPLSHGEACARLLADFLSRRDKKV